MKCSTFLLKILFLLNLFFSQVSALEIIRDTELEQFTYDIVSNLLKSENLEAEEFNIYFVKSNQINAFVTGGKNIFINTETLIQADDYREFAAVIGHELAHIVGGHIFNTSLEISNLSDKALPVYLLGIIGLMTGSTDTGLVGVMVGQASVNDGFAFYSRTQEASADQAAVSILCKNGIDGIFLIKFLNKLEKLEISNTNNRQNYRSTHPSTKNRITWISSSLENNKNCEFEADRSLEVRFELLKAKLHGFTQPYNETEAVYGSSKDIDLYATAVSNYFRGNHSKSISNMEELIKRNPTNPFYKELIGEILFANGDYKNATKYQKEAINQISKVNDLYFMILGNYLLNFESFDHANEAITYLKKSISLNQKNAYAWYLLSRAYGQIGLIPLANYATAERYFLTNERKLSYEFASKALKYIEENTPEWYRTNDLIEILSQGTSNR